MREGRKLRTESGVKLRVVGSPMTGGEGVVTKVEDVRRGDLRALKIFHDRKDLKVRRSRTEFLRRLELAKTCKTLCPPIDVVEVDGAFGHVSDFVEGESLERYLTNMGQAYPDNVKLAPLLMRSLEALHARGVAHGDIQPENFIVLDEGGRRMLKVIDFDNFRADGAPSPFMLGHRRYLPPELRDELRHDTGRGRQPSEFTDRYEAAGVAHELLLLKHFVDGHDATEQDFDRAVRRGVWLHDPDCGAHGAVSGLPSNILSADLQELFRKAFSTPPEERPRMEEWGRVLDRAYRSMYQHDACGGFVFVDPSITTCPYCGDPYPVLTLVVAGSSRVIALHAGAEIGRGVLKSRRVSRRHAICRRVGPETHLESIGRNGTFQRVDGRWKRIPDGVRVLVEKGCDLRFADVECRVVEVAA